MAIRPADHGIFASAAGGVALGAYFAGGEIGASVAATVNKVAFADDSRTTLGTGLAAARYGVAGAANSGVAA